MQLSENRRHRCSYFFLYISRASLWFILHGKRLYLQRLPTVKKQAKQHQNFENHSQVSFTSRFFFGEVRKLFAQLFLRFCPTTLGVYGNILKEQHLWTAKVVADERRNISFAHLKHRHMAPFLSFKYHGFKLGIRFLVLVYCFFSENRLLKSLGIWIKNVFYFLFIAFRFCIGITVG